MAAHKSCFIALVYLKLERGVVLGSPGGPEVQCKVVLHKGICKNNSGLLVLISFLLITLGTFNSKSWTWLTWSFN